MLAIQFVLLCILPGLVSGNDALHVTKAGVVISSPSVVSIQKPENDKTAAKSPPKPSKKISAPLTQAVSPATLPANLKTPEEAKVAKPAKTDGAVFQTLLTALAAMYGLFFAILGVVVQVGTQESLSLLRRVFPVHKYIAWSLSLLFIQSCAMVFFTRNYWAGYSAFVVNLVFLGWLTTHTIRFLDRNFVIEMIVREYFND